MKLSEFARNIIDSATDDLLMAFVELPLADAIAALETLNKLPMMSINEAAYPKLPALFQNSIYQTAEIRESIEQLSKIMYNRQPQNPVKYSKYQSNDVNYGIFSLTGRVKESISAQDVRDYLKYKFASTAFRVIAFNEAKVIISKWKESPKHKHLYYKYFAAWIKQAAAEDMPIEMRNLLLSQDVLKKRIYLQLKALEKDKKFAWFLSYLDDDNVAPQARYSITFNKVIDQLYNKLTPTHVDAFLESSFNALFFGVFAQGGGFPTLEVLKNEPYQSLKEKLQEQIESGDDKFSYLEGVTQDFIKVAEVQQNLNLYGGLIKLDEEKLVKEAGYISQDYLKHLKISASSEQKPLEEVKKNILGDFLHIVHDFNKEKEVDWVSNFFATFFIADDDGKEMLFKKMCFLALEKNKFDITDSWLSNFFSENLNREDGVVDITPYYINYIFLYAVTRPVEKWSSLYSVVFQKIIELLNSSNTNLSTLVLKRDSYPVQFLDQLIWLQKKYAKYIDPTLERDVGDQPLVVFPLCYYPESISAFLRVIRPLSADMRTIFYMKFKDLLPQLIITADDYRSVIACLSPEQRAILDASVKDQMPQLIKTRQDLISVIYLFNPEQIIAFCASVKDQLHLIIKTTSDFVDILMYLNFEQRAALYKGVKDQMLSIFKKSKSFMLVFNYLGGLNSEQRIAFYESVKDQLPRIINGRIDLSYVLSYFGSEYTLAICESVKDKFPELITSICSYTWLCCNLGSDKRKFLFLSIKDHLLRLIKSIGDFGLVIQVLDHEQIDFICENIKDELPRMVQENGNRFIDFRSYEIAKKNALLASLKDKLPSIIISFYTFYNVFDYLNFEQKVVFCESLKDKLSIIIPSHYTLIGFEQTDRQLILNTIINVSLDKYLTERSQGADKYKLFSYYNKQEKIDAVKALKELVNNGTTLDKKHFGALQDGSLGKIIKKFLNAYTKNITIKQFLNENKSSFVRPK